MWTPTRSPEKTPTLPTRASPRDLPPSGALVEPPTRAPKMKWTREMDQIMLDALLEQVALGRKCDNGFKKDGYQAAADAVRNGTNTVVTWDNVRNRLRYHRREYSDVKDMLAASGFGWDHDRMVVTAPDDVWEGYLRVCTSCINLTM